jgi:hypothetical protein
MSSVVSLDSYISRAKQAYTHVAKQLVLADFLRDVFGVQLEDLIPGIEKKVGSRILGVKGRIDLLYSDIMFEVKVDLDRELENAKEELKKYFQALIEMNPQGRFIGIVTDLIKFKAFIPIVEKSLVKGVKEISAINVLEASPNEVILWLDSYIFSKPKIKPTASDLKFRFGSASPTYVIAIETLKSLWKEVKQLEDVRLRYELWIKNMEIVYGSKPEEEAFIEQTYLVTLVKLVTYLALSGDNKIDHEKVLKALNGQYFVEYGVLNLVEEDFFVWILHRRIRDKALELFYSLAMELLRYDLSQIDEDFFKEIYEDIVERGQRHRLGEYYTPEWLAELVLREALNIWWKKESKIPRIFDPACGSGTFLVNAIKILKKELKSKGWNPNDILNYVLSHIVGVDVNPMAVIIARANYLLALGELRDARRGPINIPVYVADSIKLPITQRSLIGNIPVYVYEIDKKSKLLMPADIVKNKSKFAGVVSAFKNAINAYRNRRSKLEALKAFENTLRDLCNNNEVEILKLTLGTILDLIDLGRDDIWIYMINNVYMPSVLREIKFDILVGNPPWIVLRSIENKDYQEYIKKQFILYELISGEQTHLVTDIEVATLFFCMTSDLYLNEGGIIGFLLPRSVITGALHHAEFKKFKKPPMTLLEVINLEGVSPLFNVPACALIAMKGGKTSYPVPAKKLTGKLPTRNINLENAYLYLTIQDYNYQPPQPPHQYMKSPYYENIKMGAIIMPKAFWFVDILSHPVLGIDPARPHCKTSASVIKKAKKPWNDVVIEGNVEKDFIYVTVTGEDLLPFKCRLRPIVLPIEPSLNKYTLLDVDELRKRGYVLMADWLEKTQKIWEKKATKRSLTQYPRIISWINYMNKLTSQNPGKRYILLYNKSGANVVSCVVDKQNLNPIFVDKIAIKPRGFVADTETMYYETDDEDEAHYLCAILNSAVINNAVKPYRSERDIVRRPFMIPIPKFDLNNPIHKELAELSKTCHKKLSTLEFTKKSTKSIRDYIRALIKEEIEQIDRLVSQLLGFS